ncbi:vWA domain-containing protein [Euzebya tangerina]|uniref:vWA domain-containing protein n=1 Tax=Euzebya tangerina TaxID=591198 RepID=UPI00196AEADD|nr:vWA domain-containing protein [Euzebya tangerina]
MLDTEAFDRALEEDADDAATLLMMMAQATDEELRAKARALASSVVLDLARRGQPRQTGVGRLRRQPAERGGDLDIDASMEALVEGRAAGRPPQDLISADWSRPALALCLLIDTSGSMEGSRLATAALTAAACALRAPGDHAVVTFSRHAEVLRPMDSTSTPESVVDRILSLRGHGVTSVRAALEAAGAQLARTRAQRRVAVLLSDCRSTDDQDPTAVAGALEELVILAPAEDHEQAEALARSAGARWVPLAGAAEAPSALRHLLT